MARVGRRRRDRLRAPRRRRAFGSAAIRASFEAIFANGGIPVRPEQVHRLQRARLRLASPGRAPRRCRVKRGRSTAWVMATNVYLKTAQGWRLVAHHASPGLAHEPPRGRRGAVDTALMQGYRAPRWLPGGNLQTIWAARASRRHLGRCRRFERERWDTPDGDFIDVDHLAAAGRGAPPRLVLFHGLEGSIESQYAQAFASAAQSRGWACSVPHFRGCSGELNRAPRAYHSGDFEEVGWILQRLRLRHGAPLLVVGVSLGGNALLRWAAGSRRQRRRHGRRGGCGVLAHRPGGVGRRHRPRLQPARLRAHVPGDDEAQGAGQVAAAPGAVRPRATGRGTHAVRVRRCLHRAAARLPRHARLLAPCVGQAAPGAHPHPGAGAQRRQRPLRAIGIAARAGAGGALRHAVAAGARRPRGLPARPFPGRRARHAAGGRRLARRRTPDRA